MGREITTLEDLWRVAKKRKLVLAVCAVYDKIYSIGILELTRTTPQQVRIQTTMSEWIVMKDKDERFWSNGDMAFTLTEMDDA